MAYFNGYPVTYPQYYPQFQQNPSGNVQNNAQIQQNGIIWVSGEAGAKAYLVAPNTTVQLWDSESKTIFLKSADASGMPSMKVLEYTIRGEAAQTAEPVAEFATKDDLKALEDKIREEFSRRRSRLMKEDENE